MNAKIFFVGSDDVPADAKSEATRAIHQALEAGWRGLDIAEIVPLDQIAHAHDLAGHPVKPGRVIVAVAQIVEREELFERERGNDPDFQVWDRCALACETKESSEEEREQPRSRLNRDHGTART